VDPDDGRRAALKLFRDPAASRSLGREYRALAGLDHPGIVRVLGRGEHRGHPFLTMELVVGRAAQACARRAGVPGSDERTALSLRVVHDLLEALVYLHRRGILHRDVKSSNVLADASGQVKLLDLGTAGYERRGSDARAWVPGLARFAGTVTYASPEQLQGRALDSRSDLFSVGVLWYRMLTGELPYQAQSREQAVQVREGPPPAAPHQRIGGVPAAVGELVMGLLRTEREQRPSEAESVLQQLRPLLVGGARRGGELWPGPAPLFGRRPVLDTLEGFLDGQGPGPFCLLQGAPGVGVPELMRWVGQQGQRAGRWVLAVSADGDGPGNLISRLLLAVPRHLRRGLRRVQAGDARAANRVARAVELLARLERAQERALQVQLFDLQRCDAAELAELVELLQLAGRRGLGVRALGSWVHPEPGLPEPFARTGPGLLRVVVEPLPGRAASWHLRSLVGGRALPITLEGALLREAGGAPDALERALQDAVSSGRLRPGRTPEGTACWTESLVGLDEPPGSPGPTLLGLLGRPVDGAPWHTAQQPSPGHHGVSVAALTAALPEEHPEPRVRAVLHAWRGFARTLCGDRDLQADADLFQAEEDLRTAEQGGWEGAVGWREVVALVRAGHLAARGRHMEAHRRLLDAPHAIDAPWQQARRLALRLELAAAEGVPDGGEHDLRQELPSGELVPSLCAARAEWLLQRGRLDHLLAADSAPRPPVDGWCADRFAQHVAARASGLRLRGELTRGIELVRAALITASRWELGLPRARLLLVLAELELELFRPGVAREHLADCFVLLRHCDRPALAATRERVRGRVALACGEPDRAERAFRTGANMLRGTGFHTLQAELQARLAQALARLGRRREASDLLAAARQRLSEARAMPGLARVCAAVWEAGGYREAPDACWAPVLDWLSEADPLLLRCELARARLRHAALLHAHERVRVLREDATVLHQRLMAAQSPDDRAILATKPGVRSLLA